MKRFLSSVTVVLAILSLTGVALAQSSTNFDLSWSLLSGGGGARSSSTYHIDDTLGQWAGDASTSASYQIDPGFWYGVGSVTGGTAAGDAYETDDTCNYAKFITPGDPAQSHTFHDAGDEDWIKFDAQAGKTYVIETSNVGVNHDAVIFLHDACDAPNLGSADNAFGQTLQLTWNSTSSGTYYLKLQQHDPGVYGPDTSYDISVTVDDAPPSAPTNVRSAPANEAITLQWQRPPEQDVSDYEFCYNPNSSTNGGTICAGIENIAGGNTTYYELSGLTNGTLYYLTVRAIDFSGNKSGWTTEIANRPEVPTDTSDPTLTVQQPTTSATFTTTQASLTFSGAVADSGENLSRVQVHNTTNGSNGWDYSLSGENDTFYVGGITLSPGNNTVEVTAYDGVDNSSTKTITINRLTATSGAVIIIAGRNESQSLQTNIYHAANRAYQVFQGAGFSDDNIYYLAPTAQDPDGDGTSEVDASANSTNLQNAVETWAASRVGPGNPLHLYMMDHGIVEAFCANGCASDPVTPAQLNTWLNNLETSTGVDVINVIVEACHSGSFIDTTDDPLSSIAKAGRVVIASTGRTNNAYASAQGAYFSDTFFSCVVDSNSFKACYEQAKAAVAVAGHNQTPWMDDNGDGLSDSNDGTIAQSRYIAASFGSFRPTIKSAGTSVTDGSGTLSAQVERGAEELELVWAAVFPPSFQEPTTTTLQLGVPIVRLEPVPETDGAYTASYPNGFTEEGAYRVVFYAQDKNEIHAQPKLVIVGGSQEIFLPLVTRNSSGR